jgi:hypothetical protein
MTIKHFTAANTRAADMTEVQKDKYLTNNEIADIIMDRTQRKKTIPVGISSGNTLFLGEADFGENFCFRFVDEPGSPTLDGEWVLQVPEAIQSQFSVQNDTTYSMFVESGGSPGSQRRVAAGGRAHLHHDGEAIIEFKRDIYDIGFFVGEWVEGAVFGMFVAVSPFRLLANLPLSEAYALTATGATESTRTINIRKNESTIGTVSFTATVNEGTLSFSSDVDFAPGDRLSLINVTESPTETNTLQDVGVTLKAVGL